MNRVMAIESHISMDILICMMTIRFCGVRKH